MKTAELKYRAIDWAVAKCEGYEIVRMRGNEITFLDRTDDGALNERQIGYSTDWSQGGPIIEREGLTITHQQNQWAAQTDDDLFAFGPTPLIAAMRCYVASKQGESE